MAKTTYYQDGTIDHNNYLCTYFSPDCSDKEMFKEVVTFPTEELKKCSEAGLYIKNFSSGPVMFHLILLSRGFRHVIILEYNDSCITEVNKWLDDNGDEGDDCFDWSHFSESFKDLGEEGDLWKDKENALREKVTQVWKFDPKKENPVEPHKLPKADCIVSMYLIQQVSKTKEEFIQNLGKLATYLKDGGCLLLIGAFNKKYLKIGDQTIHCLTYDDSFLKTALEKNGLILEKLKKTKGPRKNQYTEYDSIYLAKIRKRKE
ncbi:nicotinamide N-methyltransferase-like [Gastrophryne carolinensis]